MDENFFQEDARVSADELPGMAPVGPDSVWAIAGRHYDRSGFHRFFWGDHNRKAWTTPVKVPVLRLQELYGGLTIEKKGGGFQTTSFTLQDSLGRLYALRSLDKNPVSVVPPFWRRTFVANVLRDQTSASNPYAALVVPVLAAATGVYHSNPRIFYVDKQDTSFGPYAPEVQGKLFLLQEKFESTADLSPAHGTTVDFEDSDKAFQQRYARNNYRFNQKAFARARLLDVLLGDWDRHKRQWEWAVEKNGSEFTFTPIPKDRDQVFMKMDDGLVPAIATSKFLVRKFHSFDEEINDVKAYLINAQFMDERLLNELSLQDWLQIAGDMQRQLTDAVIMQAIRRLPPPIYRQYGAQTIRNLKSRRDQLPKVAKEIYLLLAEHVAIAGTDEDEFFALNRLSDAQTEVTVYRGKSASPHTSPLYHRVFNRDETERITLYGLPGDDTFTVRGNVRQGILLEIYGGRGEDTIADSSSVGGLRKMTRIYDTKRGNNLSFGTEARDMTSRDVREFAYDREGN
ncbi:hypothetical protein MKJ04_15405 [Pontibacter sp. E15-1]|uniref:hypothetical protein n=1 Tax=Pontibacter sp. E15-1 TaxID=2919918 RepID=UPI001F4FF061|nr:hypothetical protein [Pontibacter sp. E15-1]MCJ8166234.1 hypothetical protein [Pontibacter sp. E15-1]